MTKFPLIFLAYLAVLLYYCIFAFNWPLLLIFVGSLGLVVFRKYYLLLPILLVLAVFFYFIQTDSVNKMAQQNQNISQITLIPDSIQVNGDLLSFQGKSGAQKYQVYYRLKTPNEQKFYKNLTQNTTLSFTGKSEIPEKQRNFNGFDNQQYLASQNIYRQVTIEKITAIQQNRKFDLHLLRRKAIVWSQNHFPSPMSSYMTGLLFGYLPKDFGEMSDIYSSLGIIHLFALSGMQVNFFIDWFRKILLRLGFRRDRVDLIQIPFSIFYAFMTGWSVSVLRALFQKNIKQTGYDNLALTTLILIIVSPKFLLTIGGQLTLLYVFAISMITNHMGELTGLRRSLTASSVLTLIVLPLLIFDFHLFQPASILLTFVFAFLFDLLLLPLLLGSFWLSLMGLSVNSNFLFQLLESFVQLIDRPLHYPLVLGKPNGLLFIFLLIIISLLIDHFKKKKIRVLLILVALSLFFFSKNPIHPSITLVDVGQGDSIFLQDQFNSETTLIDTGGRLALPQKIWQKAQSQTNAEKTLIPFLESVGVSHIDHLILTHTDDDHVGDFVNLADKIKIRQVWVSPGELTHPDFISKLKSAKIPIHLTKKGDTIPIFHSQLQVLSAGYSKKGDNNDSIVTYGNFYGQKFLFTGDLEQIGENQLLEEYPNLKVDILKVGHHGSKSSSGSDFISEIKPRIALISVGKNNRYGHPNQESLQTFQKNKVQIFRTDQQGAIKFVEKQGKWHIETVK